MDRLTTQHNSLILTRCVSIQYTHTQRIRHNAHCTRYESERSHECRSHRTHILIHLAPSDSMQCARVVLHIRVFSKCIKKNCFFFLSLLFCLAPFRAQISLHTCAHVLHSINRGPMWRLTNRVLPHTYKTFIRSHSMHTREWIQAAWTHHVEASMWDGSGGNECIFNIIRNVS